MSRGVEKLIAESTRRFRSSWPTVGPTIGGGDIESLEDIESIPGNEWAKGFDTECGCDFIQVFECNGVRCRRFLATRCQYTKPEYPHFRTLTLRLATAYGGAANTEVNKRLKQIENETVYPPLTYHGYYGPEDVFVGGYVAKTREFLLLCKDMMESDRFANYRLDGHPRSDGWGVMKNPEDGNLFVYISQNILNMGGVTYNYISSEPNKAVA